MLVLGLAFVWIVSLLDVERWYRMSGRAPYDAPLYPPLVWALRLFGAGLVVASAWLLASGLW